MSTGPPDPVLTVIADEGAAWIGGRSRSSLLIRSRATLATRVFPRLAFADQVLATVLHLRLSLPDDTLAVLFTTSRITIRRAVVQVGQLLDQHGTRIEPVTAPEPLTRLLANRPSSAR